MQELELLIFDNRTLKKKLKPSLTSNLFDWSKILERKAFNRYGTRREFYAALITKKRKGVRFFHLNKVFANFFLLLKRQEQYKFVYDTLEETLHCGMSWFPVSELSSRLKQKSLRAPGCKMNEYQREYEVSTARHFFLWHSTSSRTW